MIPSLYTRALVANLKLAFSVYVNSDDKDALDNLGSAIAALVADAEEVE